jgi:hypothetical protein
MLENDSTNTELTAEDIDATSPVAEEIKEALNEEVEEGQGEGEGEVETGEEESEDAEQAPSEIEG